MQNGTPGRKQTATSLYLYYDQYDVLLYVGITARRIARNREHNGSKIWWEYVVRQAVEHYDSYEAAHRREVELIGRHRPPFNRQHNPDAERMRAAYEKVVRLPALTFNDAVDLLAVAGGRLPVWLEKPSDTSNRRTVWFAPEHVAVTARMNLTSQKNPPVLISGGRGTMVGRVTQLHRVGPFVTGVCNLPRDDRWPSVAQARIKDACVKGQSEFRLTSLHIEDPHGITAAGRALAS